jgi:predicted outer membrane repeat protein
MKNYAKLTFSIAALLIAVFIWNILPDSKEQLFVNLNAINPQGTSSLIIFVHGLGGDSNTTWLDSNGKTWMTHFDEDDGLKTSSIYSVDYPTGATGSQASKTQIARQFAEQLKKIGKDFNQITVVSHSLGGLISRQALTLTGFERDSGKFITLITLGSPFDGSRLADVANAFPLKLTSQQVNSLDPSSEGLSMLQDAWESFTKDCGDRLKQYAAYETIPIAGKRVLVVNRDSAVKDVPVENTFAANDTDHFALAKKAPGDPLYEKVHEWVTQSAGLRVFSKKVHLTNSITIAEGATLRLLPGTTVQFEKGVVLKVFGKLFANGTKDNPIHFEFSDSYEIDSALVLQGHGCNDSKFSFCKFSNGGGASFTKGDPAQSQSLLGWIDSIRIGDDNTSPLPLVSRRACGGAITLVNTNNVDFTNCEFEGNHAWIGGAVALLGTQRSDFNVCTFSANKSVYGGGAIYSQWSDYYLSDCIFEGNFTGEIPKVDSDADKATIEARAKFACGGAVYTGLYSSMSVRASNFRQNHARNAGAAIYAYNTHASRTKSGPSLLVSSSFVSPKLADMIQPSVVYLDKVSLVEAYDLSLNGIRIDGSQIDDLVWNASSDSNEVGAVSGFKLDKELVPQKGVSVVWDGIQEQLFEAREKNPTFRRSRIDTIVIHHISAIKWGDPSFRESEFHNEILAFEKEHADLADILKDINLYKFEPKLCMKILDLYGVSAHYLIDRNGGIIRLVRDEDVAYHAGSSVMPEPDNRTNVNWFSIGIEMISTHPDDDVEVATERTPAYTEKQYTSLALLTKSLRNKYGIKSSNIVGHDEIAGDRAVSLGERTPDSQKKDPGPMFDWAKFRELIR